MNLKVLILSTCFSLALATPTAISSKKRPDMRIVGGEYIRIKSAPYQVSLLSIETNRAFCGGSIISSSFILTAGHCVNNLNKSDHLIIGAGSIYNDARDGVRKSVAKIFVHKKFNVSALYDFDFALLKLQTPLKLSDKIQVIELPEKNEAIKEGLGCRVSGWGATLNQNEPREILRAATLLTWNQKKCIEKLERVRDGGALVASAITDRMFCAGYVEGMIDACAGELNSI